MGAQEPGPRKRLSSGPWRVFLSHTSDLAELPGDRTFVAAAQSAVLRAGDAVTDMGYFTARDNAPADYCKRMVSQASVYVAIVGHRYGTPVRGLPDRSYTELEYEVATTLGLPRLIFMTRDDSSSARLDQSSEQASRQDAFRRRLLDESNVTVAWITTPADLELSLYQALTELRRDQSTHRYPNNLRRLRAKGRSQEEVAHSVGVSTSTYQTWEYGDRLPYPVNVQALCDYFGVDEPALGFEVAIAPDPLRETTTTSPIAESATPMPPLRAVNELVDWLATATGKPVDELDSLVRRRVSQLSASKPRRGRPWRSAGRQQMAHELIGYYGRDHLSAHGLSPYGLVLAGKTLSLSIVTRNDWRGSSVELVNPTVAHPALPRERCSLVAALPVPTPWTAVMDRAVTLLARAEIGAQTGDGPIILNKPLYRLMHVQLGRDQLQARFAIDWFAHYALSFDLLESELTEVVTARLDGDMGSADLRLPLRDELMGSAAAVAAYQDRLCAGGIIGLFVVARPATWSHDADFLIVVQRRSHRVLNLHGSLTTVPRGFHQHMRDARDEVSLGATVYREIEEELLGRDDFDESTGRERLGVTAHHVDRLTEPMRWLSDHDAAHVQCVALGMNLVTGNYEFACLICVPNEEFWTRYGGACLPNWEAADIQTHSSLDPDGLRELILDDTWTDGGLFALLEGLRRLADQYPERVRLPELEWLI